MGIRSFKDYSTKYKNFYGGVLELARMENRSLDKDEKEISFEEAKKYNQLKENILSQCPVGTDIEDLIGLVVVGELRRRGRKKRKI